VSPATYADLQQSYGRCLREDSFIDKFYERFLASDPRIRAMFEKTDFAKQRMALRRGISMAILHADGSSIVERPMGQMADVHARAGRAPVPPELYPLWVNALLDTIKATDPKADDTLMRRWREAMEKVTAMFVRHY
jgi:hemoglobin-like flavoprotein